MKNLKNKFSKLLLRRQKPIEELEHVQCKNCDCEFQGYYCPNCGQEITEFNRPISFVFYDFMGNFFAFDTRFFKTFWNLLVRPGFLTIEFFKGRRVRYSPPFRVFIFLSFVLFLLLQLVSYKGLDSILDSSLNDPANIVSLDADTTAIISLQDSLLIETASQELLR